MSSSLDLSYCHNFATGIPWTRYRHLSSGRTVDSIWHELKEEGIWRSADFEAHEANTLAGAGDRSDWLPILADWFPIANGQIWCSQRNRPVDPTHIPSEGPGSMDDFLQAVRTCFDSFRGRKIGVQLSGGVDSSLIIGLLRHFEIPHGLVGLRPDRYEFRTEQRVQDRLAARNSDVELIPVDSCLPCSRLEDVPPHQIPDLLSLNYSQDQAMAYACKRLGIEVLLSGGGGDNLLGQAVPNDPRVCRWRPQTFTDPFPVEIVYRPQGIEFQSFYGDSGVVDAIWRLRRGQSDDYRKLWARQFLRQFLPQELVDYQYCADFWGISIDGILKALNEIRQIHQKAFLITGNSYFAETNFDSLLAHDLCRPCKDLYQRIEARISSAVWIYSLAQWLGEPEKHNLSEGTVGKITF